MHSSECIFFWQIHRTGQHTEILGKHWYSLQLELFSEFYSWTYSVKVIRWIPRILLMVIFKVNSCKWSLLCLQILSRVSQTSYTVQVTWHQGVLPTETFLTKCLMREEYDTGEGEAGRWWGRRRKEKGGDYESSIGISPTWIQEEKPKIRWKAVTSEYSCTVQQEEYIFQTWK